MAKLTLSLGSNRGDRHALLATARNELAGRLGPLSFQSAVIETEAWGNTQQAGFLNQLVICRIPHLITERVQPVVLHRLLDITQSIETALGRVRRRPWGPRTMDIDLIFLDDVRYEDHRISLPHPWWRQRAFVTDLLPPTFDPYLHALNTA